MDLENTSGSGASPAPSEQLIRLEGALRQSEKLALIGRISASVMHEINNPAEAIGNLIYLIAQNADKPELVKSLSGQVEEQLLRIRYVARQTLSYFRESPQRQNTDLVALIETAIRFHEPLLSKRSVKIARQMPPGLTVAIYPGDFLQVVSNLLRNAIEAVEVRGTLCIRARNSGNIVRMTIADNGCGIPHHLRSRLFEPFQTSKAEVGNGLGLWICKVVVERHGGRIAWRTSTEPKTHGTVFSVSIAS